jgi:hypothetical protein
MSYLLLSSYMGDFTNSYYVAGLFYTSRYNKNDYL